VDARFEHWLRCPAVPRGKRRKPPAVPRSLLVTAALAIVLLAGVVWWVYLRTGTPGVADFSFDIGKVGGRPVGDPAPREDLEEAAVAVRDTLDDLFVEGFIDPSEWRGGQFPGIFDAFSGPAVKKARSDIPVLTLGPDARQIAFMRPRFGRLNVRFLTDEEGGLTGAVATTSFAAQGEFAEGGPVLAQHEGTWFMRPLADQWLIVGYRARGTVGPGQLPRVQATPA
jgi:hypothetical protein